MGNTLLDFSGYLKFFVGLFALVNPVGILPVFMSMTNYQTAAVRNKTNMIANFSVAVILCTSLLVGDKILIMFGISIESFRIAGGTLIVLIAMSMISGKLGEDKQNKQEQSETAIRDNIGVVPLALPLMAGRGYQFLCGLECPLAGLAELFRTGADQHRVRVLLLAVVPLCRTVGEIPRTNRYQRCDPYYGSDADVIRY